jgi:hypothetical protein
MRPRAGEPDHELMSGNTWLVAQTLAVAALMILSGIKKRRLVLRPRWTPKRRRKRVD